jgi:twitching motility two-component system response regulator PilG
MEQAFPRLETPFADDKSSPRAQESTGPTLKLLVRGLERDERQLLDGLVRVSLRRSPRLEILEEKDALGANVVLIGANDSAAVAWARQQDWIENKAVIWIGGSGPVPTGHTIIRRPVQWSILPILLARALENGPGAPPVSLAAPDTPHSTFRGRFSDRPILVVDDSLAVRNHLRSLLEAGGFAVSEADSVTSALRILSHERVDCVLMDVLMPGLDGYEGCRQIKTMLRGSHAVPVVMLTSKSSPFDRIRGKMAGCDAYLTKPIDPQHLGDVLAVHLPD